LESFGLPLNSNGLVLRSLYELFEASKCYLAVNFIKQIGNTLLEGVCIRD